MRLITSIVVIVLVIASPAIAGQSNPTQEEHLKRGAKKITIGVVLMAAGLVTMPITDLDNGGDTRRAVGAGMTVAGGAFLLWGVRDRYKAVQPQITIGATFGKTNGVYIRRRW